MPRAFQDYYPPEYSHCYGCGYGNAHGHQLKSYWDGEETIARFIPRPYHSGGVPDHAYGGLIASLLDCHGTASAFAAACCTQGQAMDAAPAARFVTASLNIRFLRPTPLTELTIRARHFRVEGRKVCLDLSLSAADVVCAEAEMLAIRLQEK